MDQAGRKKASDGTYQGQSPGADPIVGEGMGASRRLFLRGSLLVGVPLMITLKSRTVLGDTNNASGNLSGCSGKKQEQTSDGGGEDTTKGSSKKKKPPKKP